MTLNEARRGQVLIVGEIADGRTRDQAFRFGLSTGAEVRCEQVLPGGPVVLRRGGLLVAIGRRLCPKIAVEPTPRRSRRSPGGGLGDGR